MKEGGLDGLPHLQYINFSSLSDKKPVITSKKGDIKTVSVLTILPNFLVG